MLEQRSLREQVYDYLRQELTRGKLIPGAAVNLNEISRRLGISKTPLRDALLQLDTEGFVTICPRRGVFVNRLTLEEIRNIYEIIGALETTVILAVFDNVQPLHLERMKALNRELRAMIKRGDFQGYYEGNILFHGVFLDLSHNEMLKRIIGPMKRRLYDFPRRGYLREWELSNCRDHEHLIEAFEKGDRERAAHVWRDVHWSFEAQEKQIRRFYFADGVEVRKPTSRDAPKENVCVALSRRARHAHSSPA